MRRGLFLVLFIVFCSLSGGYSAFAREGEISENNKDEIIIFSPLQLYTQIANSGIDQMPSFEAFSAGLKGFNNLKSNQKALKKDILTLIDFSLDSTQKRFWVINLKTKKVLFNDLVAHGQNSGLKFAKSFSNASDTHMSSLGFYLTGGTYFGKHGLSLFLNGMDDNFNNNARKRSIVMHGAEYVSEDFVKKHGRLGRSWGCPAVSMNIYKDVIGAIKDGSCLFIYYPDKNYFASSSILNHAI